MAGRNQVEVAMQVARLRALQTLLVAWRHSNNKMDAEAAIATQ